MIMRVGQGQGRELFVELSELEEARDSRGFEPYANYNPSSLPNY